jgi:mycothiol synthase
MGNSNQQVQMIWPESRLSLPPTVNVPAGYKIRTFQQSDQDHYYKLMKVAGWSGWDDQKLHPWLYRILPNGWYMIIHNDSNQIVASCMATHDPTWTTPFCGELAWLAGDPTHSGKGLGTAAAAAVTSKFIQCGYKVIHLFSEPFRLAALKIYLSLGYIPLLEPLESISIWKQVCIHLDWLFTPDEWAT